MIEVDKDDDNNNLEIKFVTADNPLELQKEQERFENEQLAEQKREIEHLNKEIDTLEDENRFLKDKIYKLENRLTKFWTESTVEVKGQIIPLKILVDSLAKVVEKVQVDHVKVKEMYT